MLSCYKKVSSAFDGIHDFNAWDISHELMMTFMKYIGSKDAQEQIKMEREICYTVFILQSMLSLH